MPGILTSGPDFFPGWVSILFSLGLALGIVHHLPCLIRGHGNRWFHAAHTAMLTTMRASITDSACSTRSRYGRTTSVYAR